MAAFRERAGLSKASLLFVSNILLFLLLFLSLATLLFQNYELPQQVPHIFYYRPQLPSTPTDAVKDTTTAPASVLLPSAVIPPAVPSPTAASFVWSDISTILTFGDSLSDSGFKPTQEQPSASNPFGNPEYPKNRFLGPNWADFLTASQNDSLIFNYNFAKGGATLDNAIVPSVYGSPSFFDQINVCSSRYSDKWVSKEWIPHSTLAIIRFGVNDVVGSYIHLKATPIAKDFIHYEELVDRLYTMGVRNFLFLNVGTVDKNFIMFGGIAKQVPQLSSDIAEWNSKLTSLQGNFTEKHPDASTRLFNTYQFFLWLEQHAAEVEATENLVNTTGICPQYAAPNMDPFRAPGESSWKINAPSCGAPLEKYFWANQFHPTFSVHNATAAIIVEDCFGRQGPKRFCT